MTISGERGFPSAATPSDEDRAALTGLGATAGYIITAATIAKYYPNRPGYADWLDRCGY